MLRLLWEHASKLKTSKYYLHCFASKSATPNRLDEDGYSDYVRCLLWHIKEENDFDNANELLKQSIMDSRIGLTFQDDAERNRHYNMIDDLEELYPYLNRHCYASSLTCRDCSSLTPLYF